MHSEFKKDNVTLLVMRLFLNLLGASRVCAINVFSIWGLVRTPFLLYGEALIATQFMTKNNIAFAQGSVARLLCSVVLVYLGFGIIVLEEKHTIEQSVYRTILWNEM